MAQEALLPQCIDIIFMWWSTMSGETEPCIDLICDSTAARCSAGDLPAVICLFISHIRLMSMCFSRCSPLMPSPRGMAQPEMRRTPARARGINTLFVVIAISKTELLDRVDDQCAAIRSPLLRFHTGNESHRALNSARERWTTANRDGAMRSGRDYVAIRLHSSAQRRHACAHCWQ